MAVQTERGIILRGFPYGEGHKVMVFLSPEAGKVSAIAKGVRKTKSRWGGRLEPFTAVELGLFVGKGMPTITSAHTLNAFPQLRQNLQAVLNASVMVEAVDAVSQPNQPSSSLYDLLRLGLAVLDQGTTGPEVITSFLLKLSQIIGFAPTLDRCVLCGDHDNLGWFSPAGGGTLCQQCRRQGSIRVSADVTQGMFSLSGCELEQIPRLEPPKNHTALGLTRKFVEFHLERPLASLEVHAPSLSEH